jgi:hypothetical protein
MSHHTLSNELRAVGLMDPKWLSAFQENRLTSIDDIWKEMGDQEVYENLMALATEAEKIIIQRLYEKNDIMCDESIVYDDILHSKLQELALNETKWGKRFKEVGIETMKALKYAVYDTFLYLIKLADEQETKSLRMLLEVDENTCFSEYWENIKKEW